MKRKDLLIVAVLAIVSGILTLTLAGNLFGQAETRRTAVPVVTPIEKTLPDIKNDSAYNKIFNSKALNPSQPVQFGSSNEGVFQ